MNAIIIVEDVVFKHNKYCNVTIITIINILLSALSLYFAVGGTFITSLIQLSLYLVFFIAILYQNKGYLTIRSTVNMVLVEFIHYWFIVVSLPLQLVYSFFYDRGSSSNHSDSSDNNSSRNDDDIM